MKPLDTQVGGDHYKKLGIQPFELVRANFGYEGLRAAVYAKVNKYLLRNKGDHIYRVGELKAHKISVEKAIHCLQVQMQLLDEEIEKYEK